MKTVNFSICREILTHPNKWAIVEMHIEKGIHDHVSFKSMHGAILLSA